MPPDRPIGLMKNRPGLQDRFHVPECLFDLPEILVLEGDPAGGQVRIGPQNSLAFIAGFLFDLRFVDGDMIAHHLEVFPVPPVAH